MDVRSLRYSIIGCGTIGSMVLSSIIDLGVGPESVHVTVRAPESIERIRKRYPGVRVSTNNVEAARESNVVFVCVKPRDLPKVVREIREELKGKLLVSTAAAVQIKRILELSGTRKVVRAIPNVCGYVKRSLTFVLPGPDVTREELDVVLRIFGNIGECHVVSSDEELDVYTIAFSCGVGFISYIVDKYVSACNLIGIEPDRARELVAKMLEGISRMMMSGLSPSDICNMVATPGGLTAYGLYRAELSGLSRSIMRMLWSAYRRISSLQEKVKMYE